MNGKFIGGIAALGLLMASLLAPATWAADDLSVITEDYPPLNYVEDQHLKGPSVEIVQAIIERLGGATKVHVLPWARGYNYLKTKKNTALFSTTGSKTRENLFKWVGPLAEKKIGLYAKRGSGIKLTSLADAKPYVIGVQRAGHGMQFLQARGFTNFDESTTATANLRKLLSGRNDLWFASNATLAGNSRRMGIDMEAFELALEVDNTFMSIAFNMETPDRIVDAWQSAFEALVEEGAVKRIFQSYGLEDLYPSQFDG